MSSLITKVDNILGKLEDFKKKNYWDSNVSIEEVIIETELLFYFYDPNYPSLFEIRQLKERYSNQYSNFKSVIGERLIFLLVNFKENLQSSKKSIEIKENSAG